MKLKQINEAGHANQPALVSIDWGEHTEVYGPFKSREAARTFCINMEEKAQIDGLDLRDLGIFNMEVHQPVDPQEAVDDFNVRLGAY